jgi:LPS sulfotransferase NodH
MEPNARHIPTRFVVLFEHRSGSTYLVEALNSHSRIRSEKELLAVIRGKVEKGEADPGNQLRCIDKLYVPGNHGYDVIGFKTKIKDILDPVGMARVLKANEARVILLQRRNRIKLRVSLINAMRLNEATGDWNRYDETVQLTPLHIEVGGFKRELELEDKANRELNEYARSLGLPVLELHYEDLLADSEEAFRRVCGFLGTNYEPLEAGTKKNTSDDLRHVVANFDELKAAFAGTAYEPMFDEVMQPQSSAAK